MTVQQDASPEHRPAAIIGGGSIGVSFAVSLLSSGRSVQLQDPDAARLKQVPAETRARLETLREAGLTTADPDAALERLSLFTGLEKAAEGVSLVIECAPEKLALKQQIFRTLGEYAPDDAVLASASSALLASEIAADLPHRDRCLILHPVNPPHVIPVLEVAPAEFTSAAATDSAMRQMAAAGFQPVLIGKEANGLVFNRLQGAILREAYCLVRDGVATPEAIDEVVRDALGMRWSVSGPFETVDLNTRGGVASHAEKMGPAYLKMGRERGQDDPWTPEMVKTVETARRRQLPMEEWESRVRWRQNALMRLAAFRRRDAGADG